MTATTPTTSFHPSSEGVEVALHDFGGSGPVVIFCHATGFCGHVWEPLVESFVDRYRCLALDFRAHGRSVRPAGASVAWTAMADDLLAVIDGASLGEPVLAVGHSMGGTAIVLAETARPHTFARAWLYEPILFPIGPAPTGDDGPAIAQATRKRRSEFDSRREVAERFGSKPPFSLLDDRVLAAYVEHGVVEDTLDDGRTRARLRCSPEDEAEVYENENTGADELIGTLAMPLVVAASGDGNVAATSVVAVADRHSHLALASYPDLTHFGPLQEPDRLAVDVLRFFAG